MKKGMSLEEAFKALNTKNVNESKHCNLVSLSPIEYCDEFGCELEDITPEGTEVVEVYFIEGGSYTGIKLNDGKYFVMGANGDHYVDSFEELKNYICSEKTY